mmetsp:Transcript_13234/g.43137  ORF Transcript_13234/g.43137 Transcript_13234/m.43137 type:complete len:364 (+) Transcript_13234:61-1152(+)|eukprot:CAMPEP_0118915146 /NCGR_PEP_ID=MMETSP1166-20130328/15373_1 /TAXON_ID=1104430 /ORGANISM="Chrysoreinhardia sp, Strain CCMP3193" /LENGTH=363 /DNA_ID=CAMNT_0006854807 /DNA_START=41 /DNA_END=1132 /DNA_ORIENTATION=-
MPLPLWKEIDVEGGGLSVEGYLERLKLTSAAVAELRKTASVSTVLTRLIRAQIDAIPFENLDVYGAPRPRVAIDIRATYDKLVRRRRGGFCFEVNVAFGWLLRRLGFDAKYALARVWRGDDPAIDEARASSDVFEDQTESWDGHRSPTHVVVVVVKEDSEENSASYVCDVGFGDVPRAALPLKLKTHHECSEDIEVPGDHTYRFVREPRKKKLVTLYRLSRGSAGLKGIRSPVGTPEPRILFDTNLDRPKAHFEPGLIRCQTDPNAIFRRFLLVVRHDLDGSKVVLQGRRLRITKPTTHPRGDDDDGVPVQEETVLETYDAFIETLAGHFLITSLRGGEKDNGERAIVDDALRRALLPEILDG